MKLNIDSALPDRSIADLVHSFWMLENNNPDDMPSTILPNGMIDIIVIKEGAGDWEVILRGIDTMPGAISIKAGTKMFSIGLKLLAAEYVLGGSIKEVLNTGKRVDDRLWKFEDRDLETFQSFCKRATAIITRAVTAPIDNRKKYLFDLIYASDGAMPVKELSEKVYWSSRQINRWFNQQFGIPVKTYCNILRFGASFKQLSEGRLYPEQDFTDQNHFIKEIKKYAGVTPKELSKNKDDRFVNITAIKKLPS